MLLRWFVPLCIGCVADCFPGVAFRPSADQQWRGVLSCPGCGHQCTQTSRGFGFFLKPAFAKRRVLACALQANNLPTLGSAMRPERHICKTSCFAKRPASHIRQIPCFAMFSPSHIRQTPRFPIDAPCMQTVSAKHRILQ